MNSEFLITFLYLELFIPDKNVAALARMDIKEESPEIEIRVYDNAEVVIRLLTTTTGKEQKFEGFDD